MEVLLALRPVGEASDRDLAEDRLERAMVSKLDGVVHDALGVAERDGAHLARRSKLEVVLEQLAAQLAPGDVESGLELLVGQTGGLAVAQEADKTPVERVGGREGVCWP